MGADRQRPEPIGSRIEPPQSSQRQSFSVTKILDLELRAQLRRLRAGAHMLEMKVYTPRGHLYQVLPVALEGARSHEHAPLAREGGAAHQRVMATLPVAGTSIVAGSLFGRWRVDLHLDGAQQSCGAPAYFRLTP